LYERLSRRDFLLGAVREPLVRQILSGCAEKSAQNSAILRLVLRTSRINEAVEPPPKEEAVL
jgi:hypothetical protein